MTTLLTIIVSFLALYTSSADLNSSEPAFDTLKGLQGRWSIQSEGTTLPIQMSYEVGSKGSRVTEQFGKELSVFYRNGRKIEMIHFCNAGNQPRLKLKRNNRLGLLIFEMFDITNLDSTDTAHVKRIIYKLIDNRRIDLEIIWQEGRSQNSEKYSLTKI